MTKYNSFMLDLVADRLSYTDDLIESWILPIDAKYMAAAEKEDAEIEAKIAELSNEYLNDATADEELRDTAETAAASSKANATGSEESASVSTAQGPTIKNPCTGENVDEWG